MVKEKINSVRTYDEDGYRRRAACLCFKDESEQEILLVSSSKHKDKWVVPGGGIEPLEEPTLAAVREALEEAGAKGHLGRKIGDFENKEKKHRTSLYAFTVTDLLDEWEDGQIMGRQRQWFSIIEAKDHLAHKPVQVTYLDVLPKDLNGVVKR
ncbi:diphosphoinositol polyphosphate phosphohydrolase 1-like [Mercenaria mercenaria]|uniref:diphosphoinositol polyphosphate phosphohydrolase 1-like n=1 Tax=Mercenaria mercenaria TaxID=6596 RepID=UPI00234E8CE7|nr:diphosphoinositol polyphosphate phosphohydrolase 1-like [Mercenaria mercenaria]